VAENRLEETASFGRDDTQVRRDDGVKLAVALSVVSLLFSGLSFYQTHVRDDQADRDLERRLACLELEGSNDCGADGR
jgi:hypothetical protein